MFTKKEFGIFIFLRFVSMKKFHAQLSWAWNMFMKSGPGRFSGPEMLSKVTKITVFA